MARQHLQEGADWHFDGTRKKGMYECRHPRSSEAVPDKMVVKKMKNASSWMGRQKHSMRLIGQKSDERTTLKF